VTRFSAAFVEQAWCS